MKLSSFIASLALSAVSGALVLRGEPLTEEESDRAILSQRDDTPNYYAANITKGRSIWRELQSVLGNPDAIDVPAIIPDIQSDPTWKVNLDSVNEASEAGKFALGAAGLNVNQKFLTLTAKLKENTQIYYTNSMSPSVGTLIAKNNEGYATDPHTGKGSRAPNRWSAMAWRLWKHACQQGGGRDPAGLQHIFRDTSRNPKTKAVVDAAMAAGGRKKVDDEGKPIITRWTPDDDEFFAVLATPNGIGVPHLLKDYSTELGRKTIESISVFWVHGLPEPNIWFTLKPYCG